MCNLHCITHFALVLHILHSFLSQSELSNFFAYNYYYVVMQLTQITSKSKRYKCGHRCLALRFVLALCCVFSIALHFECCPASQHCVASQCNNAFLALSLSIVLFSQVSSPLLDSYRQCVHSATTVAKVGPNLATVSGLPIACAAWLQFYSVVSRALSCWFVWDLCVHPPSYHTIFSWWMGVVIVLHVCSHVGSFYWPVCFFIRIIAIIIN